MKLEFEKAKSVLNDYRENPERRPGDYEEVLFETLEELVDKVKDGLSLSKESYD
jgi:ClpP class serine protease